MKRDSSVPKVDPYYDEITALAQRFTVNMEALDVDDPEAVAHWRQGALMRRESLKRIRKYDDPFPAIPAAVAAYVQQNRLYPWGRVLAKCPAMRDRACHARVFFQPDHNRMVIAVWLNGDGGESNDSDDSDGDTCACDVISADNHAATATLISTVDVTVAGYDTAFHLTPGRPLIINATVSDELTVCWDQHVLRTQALEAAVAMDEELERKLTEVTRTDLQ
jgi:hypothetical protein